MGYGKIRPRSLIPHLKKRDQRIQFRIHSNRVS
jgi:hypothetical protein